jgi:hypothetical protein
MAEAPSKIHLFWQRILFFFGVTIRFLGRLFFLDMWRSPEARPVLAYMLAILVLGTVLFIGWKTGVCSIRRILL